MTAAFSVVKRHYQAIVAVGGQILIIAMGILIVSGEYRQLNIEAQNWLSGLGINFLQPLSGRPATQPSDQRQRRGGEARVPRLLTREARSLPASWPPGRTAFLGASSETPAPALAVIRDIAGITANAGRRSAPSGLTVAVLKPLAGGRAQSTFPLTWKGGMSIAPQASPVPLGRTRAAPRTGILGSRLVIRNGGDGSPAPGQPPR